MSAKLCCAGKNMSALLREKLITKKRQKFLHVHCRFCVRGVGRWGKETDVRTSRTSRQNAFTKLDWASGGELFLEFKQPTVS